MPETAGIDELEAQDSEGTLGAGLALIAQGQGQSEVSLPLGLGLQAATQTRGGTDLPPWK